MSSPLQKDLPPNYTLHWESSIDTMQILDFSCGSVVKNPHANAGDVGSIPGLERSPGGEHGNLLQYSCLENPMDKGAWRATDHGVAKSWT